MKTVILTDSACDLNSEHMLQYGVQMIHSQIVLGDRIRTDRLEISAEDVIRDMQESKGTMLTNPPTAQHFDLTFRTLLNNADRILCLNTSSKISAAVVNALEAAKPFGSLVSVQDTRTVSTGLGLRVMRAAQLAWQGVDMPEIIEELNRVAPNAGTWFTVESLRFLQLNGRISSASALFGSMLHVTPTLKVEEGSIQADSRTLGHRRALLHLADSLRQQISARPKSRVAFLYAPGGAPYVSALRRDIGQVAFEDMGDHPLGAAVVANAGPGTVGFSIEPA